MDRQWDPGIAAGRDILRSIGGDEGNTPLVQPGQSSGMQTGAPDGRRDRPELGAPLEPAQAQQQGVAGFNVDALRLLGGFQVIGKDGVAALQPVNTADFS